MVDVPKTRKRAFMREIRARDFWLRARLLPRRRFRKLRQIAQLEIQTATATIRDRGQFPANLGSVAITLCTRRSATSVS